MARAAPSSGAMPSLSSCIIGTARVEAPSALDGEARISLVKPQGAGDQIRDGGIHVEDVPAFMARQHCPAMVIVELHMQDAAGTRIVAVLHEPHLIGTETGPASRFGT